MMDYQIKEIAEITGLSQRMLRHYDLIGLLQPARKENGYRIYGEEEMQKLQQILFFRELGFSLAEIKGFLQRADFDRKEAFLAHKEMLCLKEKRIKRMIASIDLCLLELEKGEKTMTDTEKLAVMSKKEIDAFQSRYRKEAVQKYGEESVRAAEAKTKDYDDEKWGAIQRRSREILLALADLMAVPVADSRVQDLVHAYREEITANYYDCTVEIYAGLGRLYMEDDRFTQYFEDICPGLALYMSEAIRYYCQNHK